MLAITIICLVLTLGYAVLMLLYRRGWELQATSGLPPGYVPKTRLSIIIPARNEAGNIGACISSIHSGQYPKELLEIIVIDDHSTDDTAKIVKAFHDEKIKCISLADYIGAEQLTAYKKKAIAVGIEQSSGDLIVTTDADCVATPKWLLHMAAVYEKHHPVMVVGPVDFTCNDTAVQLFQSIDFMSMQGITAAAHKLQMGSMSNGANLAFSREAYTGVDGYKGIDHLASGDDYLLMAKMQSAYPGRISYLKNKQAVVTTAPQPDWHSFMQQRIRWASKSGKYDDKKMTIVLAFVYLFNVSFLVLLVAGFFAPFLWLVAALMISWKIVAELYFLFPVAAFFGKKRQLRYFIPLQPLHIGYIILAGFLGFIGVYQWKGRNVK